MKRTLALVALAVALIAVAGAASGPAAAQSSANNTTSVPDRVDAGGQYSYAELSSGGVSQNVDNVPSVRALGDPPKGFAALRYRDPTLLDAISGSPGQWEDVERGDEVQVNDLQLYGSAFGETAGEYTLVIVHWQPYSPPNTTGTVAVNQSVYKKTVNFDENDLYSYHNVSIAKHLNQPYETTMWLERNGEKVDGVQWRFTHLSNPSTQSISINSTAGAWGFTLRNAIIPGFLGIIIGFGAGRAALRQAGRGPGYGIGAWVVLVGIVSMIIASVAYYQIAVILSNFPYVMGLSFGVLAFALALTVHQPVKTIAFFRRELADAQLVAGGPPQMKAADGGSVSSVTDIFGNDDAGAELFDEMTEALRGDMPQVPAVRTDDGYRVPVPGIRPFFARIFAKAATLDVSNIATRLKIDEGPIDDIIRIDPKAEEALVHKPARMVRTLPWDTIGEDADSSERLLAGAFTAAILLGPAAIGYIALGGALNIPWIGAFIGGIVSLVIAYSAEDGWIEFTAAPPMYQRAEDSLTILQKAYKKSHEEKSDRERAWEETAKTKREAREEMQEEIGTISEEFLKSFGAENIVGEGNETAEEVVSETDTPALDEEDDDGGSR